MVTRKNLITRSVRNSRIYMKNSGATIVYELRSRKAFFWSGEVIQCLPPPALGNVRMGVRLLPLLLTKYHLRFYSCFEPEPCINLSVHLCIRQKRFIEAVVQNLEQRQIMAWNNTQATFQSTEIRAKPLVEASSL